MADVITYFREFHLASVLLRLMMAMACGGLIGLERGKKHRAAGFRTYMLVCVGAALTILLGQYEYHMLLGRWADTANYLGLRTDVSRIGAQVINGIGFLGAGTIVVTGKQQVKGLTTAAGLWASACMGLAVGAGFYECVILAFLLIVLSIQVLPPLEAAIVQNARNINLYIEFESMGDVGEIIGRIKRQNAHIYEVDIDHGQERQQGNPSAVFTLRLNQTTPHTQVIAAISELDCVRAIDEI